MTDTFSYRIWGAPGYTALQRSVHRQKCLTDPKSPTHVMIVGEVSMWYLSVSANTYPYKQNNF